jgi:hypothetical protein
MILRWRHGFLEPKDGQVDVDPTPAAIARAIMDVMPDLLVLPEHVHLVPIDVTRTQVTLQGFGPFGVLEP